MEWKLLSVERVIEIHDKALNPGELQGLAKDKSLDACLNRVVNRVQYNLIQDEYHLAASYAMVIASGHCFNDANKRTAFMCMMHVLRLHDLSTSFTQGGIGDVIIELAQGKIDDIDLAEWLRLNTKKTDA